MLLMDEPFAALDEITRFKLNDDLLELWQDERFTVVFVTHSVFESVFLSNRIVVMAARPGRVFDEVAVDAPYPRDDAFPHVAGVCRALPPDVGRAGRRDQATQRGTRHDGHRRRRRWCSTPRGAPRARRRLERVGSGCCRSPS